MEVTPTCQFPVIICRLHVHFEGEGALGLRKNVSMAGLTQGHQQADLGWSQDSTYKAQCQAGESRRRLRCGARQRAQEGPGNCQEGALPSTQAPPNEDACSPRPSKSTPPKAGMLSPLFLGSLLEFSPAFRRGANLSVPGPCTVRPSQIFLGTGGTFVLNSG